MTGERIGRAQFMRRAAALGLLTATGSLLAAGGGSTPAEAAAGTRKRGLAYRGVCYDTGTNVAPGDLSRSRWDGPLMRGEIRVVAHRLHANSVTVYGSELDRLAETATEALAQGLHVWLQPRLIDRPQDEVLDHLARTARMAELLRRRHRTVDLIVGCEYMLFAPGIVPGRDWPERIANMMAGTVDWEAATGLLNEFLARAAGVARSHFNGGVTYAAASFEQVDWRPFDFVGIDYYSYHQDRAGHLRELGEFRRWRKPIVICEFGCCPVVGAERNPGEGWMIVDWDKPVPEIIGDPVRSERTQADHLLNLLAVFEAAGVRAASVFTFIEPAMPHSADPRFDLDMASYGLVKVTRPDREDPASPYRWEPKRAFRAVAARYRHLSPGDERTGNKAT